VSSTGIFGRSLKASVLVVCLLLPVLARAQFGYYTNNGSITIYAYGGNDTDIVVPDTINGLPVTQIVGPFFLNNNVVERVTIPATVTNLGDYSMFGNLESVYFLGNAPTFKNTPFYPFQNTAIRYVDGTSGWGPTYDGFTTALWSPAVPCDYAISNGVAVITHYRGTNGQALIPGAFNGVPVGIIGPSAFGGTGLTNIAIPDSITEIGAGAFGGCGFTTISLGTNIQIIGQGAFSGCINLQSIVIPDHVTIIPGTTFNNCFSLTNIQFGKNLGTIDHFTFVECDALTEIFIPGTVTNLASSAFLFCPNLSRVTFGDGFANLRGSVFSHCAKLASAIFPSSVTNISTNGFIVCPALSGLYFTGDAPAVTNDLSAVNVTIYYLPGTTGWDTTWNGRPTALWQPRLRTEDQNFGVTPNGFGFNIDWAPQQTIIVETCADLSTPDWQPLVTNTLGNGLFYFSDPTSPNTPTRYYRVKSQ